MLRPHRHLTGATARVAVTARLHDRGLWEPTACGVRLALGPELDRGAPALGIINAVTIPDYGGDTLWVSTAAIFDSLTDAEQRRCEGIVAVHAPDRTLLASVERHHGRDAAERLREDYPAVEHPLVRTHPRTGRRSLYLSPLYARRLAGPTAGTSSEQLISRLHAMLDDPRFQMRWRWRPGDLVLWDETSTCHRALTDHFPQRRVMRRCVTAEATASRSARRT